MKFALNAGAIKNNVKINERMASEKNSLSKDQIREFNDLKSEATKSKELYDTMLFSNNGKIERLEHQISELLKEKSDLRDQNASLESQLDHYSKTQESYEKEIPKLKTDNRA